MQPQPTLVERPVQFILLFILALAAGLFGVVVSALPFVAALQGVPPSSLGIAIATLSMLLALSNFAFAVGIWRRQGWAWPVAVLGLGSVVAFHIIFLLVGGGNLLYQGVAIILASVMLVLLYRPQVKRVLDRP